MDIKELIESAKIADGLGSGVLDKFLREAHYQETELTERILIDDLFMYYSQYYYNNYGRLPNRKNFSDGSNVFIKNRIRQRSPKDKTKLTWGLKCSKLFKETFNQWQQNNVEWQKKFQRIQNGKKTKRRQKENQRLDTELNRLSVLIKDTSVK